MHKQCHAAHHRVPYKSVLHHPYCFSKSVFPSLLRITVRSEQHLSTRESKTWHKTQQDHIFHTHHRVAATMGIKDLWSKALGDIKKKDAVPFSTLKGTIVGVDVSIWLHMYCHTDTVALHLNSEPKYAPTELLAKFQK